MIDRIDRHYAERFQLVVIFEKLAEGFVGEGDVMDAGHAILLRFQLFDVDNRHPVVLLIVRQEGQELVLKNGMRAEHDFVPFDELLIARRAQNEMCQFRGRYNAGYAGCGDIRLRDIHSVYSPSVGLILTGLPPAYALSACIGGK